MNTEVEIRGEAETLIRVRAAGSEYRDEIVEAITEAVRAAEAHMKAYMAGHSESGDTLASIQTSNIVFAPGGAGGGGFYEVELSIGEGVPYFNIFMEGSRDPIRASEGNIVERSFFATTGPGTRTTTGAQWMKLPAKGNYSLYHKEVSGQESHEEELVGVAQEIADQIIEARLGAL